MISRNVTFPPIIGGNLTVALHEQLAVARPGLARDDDNLVVADRGRKFVAIALGDGAIEPPVS